MYALRWIAVRIFYRTFYVVLTTFVYRLRYVLVGLRLHCILFWLPFTVPHAFTFRLDSGFTLHFDSDSFTHLRLLPRVYTSYTRFAARCVYAVYVTRYRIPVHGLPYRVVAVSRYAVYVYVDYRSDYVPFCWLRRFCLRYGLDTYARWFCYGCGYAFTALRLRFTCRFGYRTLRARRTFHTRCTATLPHLPRSTCHCVTALFPFSVPFRLLDFTLVRHQFTHTRTPPVRSAFWLRYAHVYCRFIHTRSRTFCLPTGLLCGYATQLVQFVARLFTRFALLLVALVTVYVCHVWFTPCGLVTHGYCVWLRLVYARLTIRSTAQHVTQFRLRFGFRTRFLYCSLFQFTFDWRGCLPVDCVCSWLRVWLHFPILRLPLFT